jgi:carbamoyl-phosphate synthase large subunit
MSGGGSVVSIDSSALSAAGLRSDKFEIVPRADDPVFVDHVLEVCERHSIHYVVPTIDSELAVYASARARFQKRGCEVWVSAPEMIALGRDKWRFHNWLMSNMLPSPVTAEVRDEQARAITGPVIAKPRGGSSSIGIIRARDVSALPMNELDDEYIVQQAVAGYEVTVDFAVDRCGRLLGLSARRSIEMRAVEDSKAVTIEHPHLCTEVERLIVALPGAFGVLNVAVIVDDKAGRMHFTELNPRFGGGYPLSWHAGARFPLSLMNGEDDTHRRDARPGVVMLRYDQAVFEDAPFFGDALP